MKKSVDIVIPVYSGNAPELESSVLTLLDYCEKNLNAFDWVITIAVNGPKVKIFDVAKRIAKQKPKVRLTHTPKQGKGFGLKHAWLKSDKDILSYLDVDLATDLKALPSLLKGIVGGADISIGSRYIRGSKLKRKLYRHLISVFYHKIFARIVLGLKFSDLQCGFKAVSKSFARKWLSKVAEGGWFFDTELLYLAKKNSCRINEVPVKWVESKQSGLNMPKAIFSFVKNSLRLKFAEL